MSLKAELEAQAAALKAYDAQDFEKALQIYEGIADTSKIHTNIGLIYATLGEHEAAVDSFNAATELDQYLAVAYFQCGVSNFLLGRFEYALKDFDEALLYLRGNQNINYEQLGLKYKLHVAEVIFNRGLCHIYLGDEDLGMQDLSEAQRNKATPEHDVIEEAIAERGNEYTVFSIPVGVLFRPSDTKLRNAKAKDYLGKAILINAADATDAFTTFTGATRLARGQLPSGAPINDGRPTPPGPNDRPLGRSVTAAATYGGGGDRELPVPRERERDTIMPNGGLGRSATVPNGVAGVGTGGGPQRGVSMRYQAVTNRAAAAGAGSITSDGGEDANSTGLERKMTQLNVKPLSAVGRSNSIASLRQGAGAQQQQQQSSPLSGADSRPSQPRQQQPRQRSPPQQEQRQRAPEPARLTQIYDSYLNRDGEGDDAEPVPEIPQGANQRVAQWANKTAPGAPPSAYSRAPTMFGGSPPPNAGNGTSPLAVPGIKRKPSGAVNGGGARGGLGRSATTGGANGSQRRRGQPSVASRSTVYEGEDDVEGDDGYVSGEYEDIYPPSMTKLKVKIHHNNETRGMMLGPLELTFDGFVNQVERKLGRAVQLRFLDEDGQKITLLDESDFDLALETAKDSATKAGKAEGKLEVWAEDR